MKKQDNKLDYILDALEKGRWVKAGAADCPEVSEALERCAETCFELNSLSPSSAMRRNELIRQLLGSVGSRFVIHSPFRCDFGFNIHIGQNFVGNFNLTILDEARVEIGDNVMIGPNCSLITISHAMDKNQRKDGVMAAKPIKIGNNVWIAANVVILPGVEIGDGAVIGAGSVVARSIPGNTLAFGNPCRLVREISDSDIIPSSECL